MRKGQRIGVAVAVLSVLLQGIAFAQSDRGAIAGTVFDSSGAAVGGAAITITGVDTGNVYRTTSTPEGIYRIADMAIGRYNITVEASGFQTSLQKGVLVQINTVSAVNITLQPGDVKQEVTVLADAPTLQTESSDVGTVVGQKQIEDLPLALNATGQSFVRSPETFVFLTPGTAGPGTNSDHASAGIYESKLSGGQNFGSEILLDGISTQRSDSGTAFDQTAPTVEALTEFKVTTSDPSAEYGHTSGGVESFTTKSGTNAYHGSAFELFRNEALDANPWSNDFANAQIEETNVGCNPVTNNPPCTALNKKPRDRQNDFGGSLGGPVRIPHLYNGHDKTFFFFAWEQYRNRRTLSNGIVTLPTAAERGGDFSALLGPGLTTGGTNPQPIINPCTGTQVFQGQIFDPSTTQIGMGGQVCRMPFAGNKITNISPVAQKMLSYLPATNLAGSPANGQPGLLNNFQNPQALDHVVTTETSFRIDENVTDKNKMFFSYSSREQNYLNGNNVDLPAPLTPGNYYNYYFTHYLRYGWDYLASASLLNSLTVGLNRVYTAARDLSVNGSDWDQVLGISGANGATFPNIQFNGAQYGIGTNFPQFGDGDYGLQVPNSFIVADSISWTKGRHSVRVGFEWRTYQYSVETQSGNSPQYIFWNYQTAFAPPSEQTSATLTGDPFASFLLGLPNNEQVTTFAHYPRWIQNYYAAYVEDSFKATHNLTLNLGLRWDVDTPRHDALGDQSVFSPTATNSLSPGQPGALIYGRSATGANTYYKDIGPRIGFAYAPDFMHETVFRGGYSIYYAPLTYSDFGANLTTGYSVNPNFISPDNFTPESSFDAGFPSYAAPTQSATLNTFTNNTTSYAASNWGAPGMVQNWDFEVQHQIARDLILSIGYVGQHATRLRSNLAQVNTMNPQFNYLGASLQDTVNSPAGLSVLNSLGISSAPSWFVNGWSPSGQALVGQFLRPFPQYGNITTNCCLENLGQSTYNALEAKLERHFRNGLNLLASYTYSKTITDADSSFSTETGFNSNVFGAQNPYNLNGEKAVSYQDIPHTFVISYLYELPVGTGKKYLNHGPVGKVLGGWQVSGIQRYQTGSPTVINEYATAPPTTQSPGNYRFSLIPGQSPFAPHPVKWTPSLNSIWNSGCNDEANGTFQPFVPGNPTSVNCAAFLDPSKASFFAGGGYVYGNLPSVVSWWRSPSYFNEDFSVIKRTQVREGQDVMFKLDIPNAFNRHVFGAIDGGPGDSTFGVPGGGGHTVINAARTLQATLRYEF
jgi:hypothetical protein